SLLKRKPEENSASVTEEFKSTVSNTDARAIAAPVKSNTLENISATNSNQLSGNSPTQEWANAVQQWSNKIHRPIEFFGKVVDENSQPVPAADIEFIWSQFQPEASFKTNTLSDSQGLFSLQNVTGATLGVYVSKSGYYPVKSINETSFQYSNLPGAQ